ncbi:MAG: hypothetical protein M3401_12525 [Actinomycetota bacterium]|nr:hypothetical protein [Actinomycetota bacterium]
MTRGDLSALLYRLNVPADRYRLDGSHYELAHVLSERESGWAVFLSERGVESSPIEFHDEHDACIYLLGCVCLELAESERLRPC